MSAVGGELECFLEQELAGTSLPGSGKEPEMEGEISLACHAFSLPALPFFFSLYRELARAWELLLLDSRVVLLSFDSQERDPSQQNRPILRTGNYANRPVYQLLSSQHTRT